MADRPQVDVATRLRQAREARKLSLRTIANETKLSVTALEAIERGDRSRLPGGIFTRSFVRSYAAAVGLDPEATLREFLEQFPAEEAEEPMQAEPEPARFDLASLPLPVRLGLVSIPLLVLVGYFAFRPGDGVIEGRRVAGPGLTAEARPTAPLERPIAATSELSAPSPAVPAVGSQGSLTMTLTARAECWVSASVDGQRTVARLLKAGEAVELAADREIVLTVGDPGALELTLNGEPARALGRDGRVVTVRIDPDNFRTFLPAS